MWSGDEKAVFGDSAYGKQEEKRAVRAMGIYWIKENESCPPKKRNRKKASIRCKVEHPFAYMKEKLDYRVVGAKNLFRNALRFDMNCILYNIMRADVLLRNHSYKGEVRPMLRKTHKNGARTNTKTSLWSKVNH